MRLRAFITIIAASLFFYILLLIRIVISGLSHFTLVAPICGLTVGQTGTLLTRGRANRFAGAASSCVTSCTLFITRLNFLQRMEMAAQELNDASLVHAEHIPLLGSITLAVALSTLAAGAGLLVLAIGDAHTSGDVPGEQP